MEAPLLGGSKTVVADDYTPPTSVAEVAKVFKIETVRLWKIAAPLVFLSLCNYGTNTVTTIFVGHLGELELSAVSIALSVINTFAYGFLLGMGSALETLCGQAFGAGQIHMLGIFMQRSWIILLLGCLAILPIYIFATPILKLLGQDDDIAELAGQFTILTIPNLISLAICFPAQKFLQAQTKVRVLAWIGLLALVGHCFLLWLFIHVLGWGVSGAGIAFNFSRWVIVIAQLIYIFGWCKDAWTGFSWAAFTDLWAFLKLSVASAVMLCLEVWYMMSIPLLTGGLDDAVIAVGSLSICTNLNGIVAMIFLGLEAAISVRVSNELGSHHPRAVKYSVHVAVSHSLIVGLLCFGLIFGTKNYFAVIYTDSVILQQAVSNIAWLLGLSMLLNSVQFIITGVAIGGGWQAVVAYINLGSYYCFGIPLGYLLGYVFKLGITGIWGGMISGTAVQTLILLFILCRTNWNTEVEETVGRMQRWGGQEIKPQI
ncbi:protein DETOXIFICATION 35-like [Silene latifolia]|uniref:protein DETOXIFICATION 35-like n=1 Tax=Silene latifolia TaxID=37657 RepID=UPI003D77E00B